jgi:hypothetical protein
MAPGPGAVAACGVAESTPPRVVAYLKEDTTDGRPFAATVALRVAVVEVTDAAVPVVTVGPCAATNRITTRPEPPCAASNSFST